MAYGLLGRKINNLSAWIAVLILVLAAVPAAAGGPVRIVMLGDSITAGYGLPPQDALPFRLQEKLKADGLSVTIHNAGVSGDTTAGGQARLDWALGDRADGLIVALGGNDGLRGLDPAATRDHLAAILAAAKARGLKVLLAGMLAPPNLGADYQRAFNAIFPALAARFQVPFYPFLLAGVAARPALNQADGIHPNARGVGVIVERLAPYVKRLVAGD